MRVSGINLHPVKSTAIRPVEQAYAGRAGLVGDREWMVVDEGGAMVSARELPRLFTIVADPVDEGLCLTAPGIARSLVRRPVGGEEVSVSIFGKEPFSARSAGADADRWLTAALGRGGLRLVWCADPALRRVSRAWGGAQVAFQDASAVSLASTTSMARLNAWMEEDLPVQRFRANLIVDGVEEAFAEDGWSRLRIGEAVLRAEGPISRCVMTTIDPTTLERGKDPIRTLARHRRWDGATWFAVHTMVAQQGRIAVGDEIVPE
ncbi:MAG: MOSC domain-containing protein [Nocardioides sp.]|uniref:MOSC domain-containing protein n=1 Tax=Nocardioides sp. TaxID=35761 RepID=UPI0039E4671E